MLFRSLTEELGHHLDVLLNAADTAGDEGAVFAELLLGRGLSRAEMALLRAEHDQGVVQIDGVLVSVEQANITGTDGDDVLSGTATADVINGLAGNDQLSGLGGNDRVIGDAGNDWLQGGDGNDTLSGGDGDDVMESDAGSDSIVGGAGNDAYRINYSNRTAGMVMVFNPVTGNGSITVGSEVDRLSSIESFTNGSGYDPANQVVGTAFADLIIGSNS